MARIKTLCLVLHTRDEATAGSSNHLIGYVFIGNDVQEIEFKVRPPSQGKARLVCRNVDFDYEEFIDSPLPFCLGLTGSDRWAPRTAFVFGQVEDGGERRIIPLAQNFWNSPNSYVSQDRTEGTDRWPVSTIVEAGEDDDLRDLVLYLETAPNKNAVTPGPLEFSVFGGSEGLPVLVYQTVLADMGKQAPAEQNGKYIIRLPILSGVPFRSSSLTGAQIAVRSDNAWRGQAIYLFGINAAGDRGRLLGRKGNTGWVSQDPHYSGSTEYRSFLTASFPLG